LSEKKYRRWENVQDDLSVPGGKSYEISPSIEKQRRVFPTEIGGHAGDMFYYYQQDRERIIDQVRITWFVVDLK